MTDEEKHGKEEGKEKVFGDKILYGEQDGDSLIPEIPKNQIPDPPKEEKDEGKNEE